MHTFVYSQAPLKKNYSYPFVYSQALEKKIIHIRSTLSNVINKSPRLPLLLVELCAQANSISCKSHRWGHLSFVLSRVPRLVVEAQQRRKLPSCITELRLQMLGHAYLLFSASFIVCLRDFSIFMTYACGCYGIHFLCGMTHSLDDLETTTT